MTKLFYLKLFKWGQKINNMGTSTLKGPKIDKATRDGANSYLRYGTCEMQGWRNTMVNLK
mgnify:CR=1 FL=1